MKKIYLFRFLSVLVLAMLLSSVLTACATVDDEDQMSDDQPQNGVEQTPPAPQDEVIPFYDHQTQAWRPGYWALQGAQFVWVPGKILSRPSTTAVWVSARWMHHAFGWSFEPGHWQ